MDTPARDQRANDRGFCGRVAMLALLALCITGASSPSKADASAWGDVARGPSTADTSVKVEPRSEHSDPCTDGTIDPFEDDDSGRAWPNPSCPEGAESAVAVRSQVARLAGDVLAQPYLARGPPSA